MTVVTDGKKFMALFEDYSYEWTDDNNKIEKKYDWWSSINELGSSSCLSFDSLKQLEEIRQVIDELITHAKESEEKHGKQDD